MTNSYQGSGKAPCKSPVLPLSVPSKARRPDESSGAPLLSPLTLMALGLAGAATAAVATQRTDGTPAPNPGADVTNLDIVLAGELMVEAASPAAGGDLERQLDTLVQNMMAEKASSATVLAKPVGA